MSSDEGLDMLDELELSSSSVDSSGSKISIDSLAILINSSENLLKEIARQPKLAEAEGPDKRRLINKKI